MELWKALVDAVLKVTMAMLVVPGKLAIERRKIGTYFGPIDRCWSFPRPGIRLYLFRLKT